MSDTNQLRAEIMSLSKCISNNDVDTETSFLSGVNIKKEVETDSGFDTSLVLVNVDKIKMEFEETDIKKECFDDIYEDKIEYNNQSLNGAVSEEHPPDFDIDIKYIKELEGVPEDNIPTTSKEKLSGCNLGYVSTNLDSIPVKIELIDESASEYKYDSCEKTFMNKSHLESYDCGRNETNKSSKSMRNEFNLEQNRQHTKAKTYFCDVCEKTFKVKTNFIHHKRIHTGEKPFSCEICKKSFTEYSKLANHSLLHTGERPYSCQFCNKSFISKTNLIYHERTHTGEKPFYCDVCEKSFARKSILTNHKRIHTGEKPYLCNVCDKSFGRITLLTNHKRTHTGEKPYVCSVCKKSFTYKSTLDIHSRIHTGEKPFSCDICTKTFITKSQLVSHKTVHTK